MPKIIRLLVTMVGCLTLLAISVVDHTQAAEKIPFIGAVYHGTGLAGLSSIATSPDDKHIYVTSETYGSITVFGRDEGTGLLSLIEVIRNQLGNVDGLAGASHITLSPDGKHAYVAGFNDSAVAVFSRDSTTGMLTFVEVQKAEPGGVPDLGHVEVIAINPDGKYLYTGSFDGTLVVFSRNVDTGRLTFVEVYRDDHDGIDGISWVRDIVISPDNKHVYTTSFGDRAITVFSRDSATGKLTQVEMKTQADFGLAAGAVDGEKSVEISPDGQYLYVIATNHIVLVLDRDSATGKLSLVEMHTDGQNGVDGLNQAKMLLVSPDGKQLYVASKGDNGVAVFSRNSTTGVLTFVEVQKDGQNGADGLAGARALTVSPDGMHLYVTGLSDKAVAAFSRNASSGVVTFLAIQVDGQDGIQDLGSPASLTLSPDGKHLYVASSSHDTIVVFKRNPITGNLTFITAHKNGQEGIVGLDGAASITISDDGQHVYVTTGSGSAATDDLVLLFSRDETSGLLTFVERYKEGEGGITDGLSNLNEISVSPDGKNVYVASFGDSGVTVFSREASTGKLTFVEVQKEGVNGVEGLFGIAGVTVSGDGKNVYAVGSAGQAVAVFSRDASTGQLTFVEALKNGENGVSGLGSPADVTVSPDGKYLYAVNWIDDTVVVFSRNASTGKLTFIEMLQDDQNGVDGLDGAQAVAVSPDSRFVYVVSSDDNALTVFSRDAITGALTFIETQKDGQNGVDGLNGALAVIVSPDNRQVYTAGRINWAIAFFGENSVRLFLPQIIK